MSPTEPAIPRLACRLAHLIGTVELALQVRRERRTLLAMDDRMLKDMGLNSAAYAEAARPFWDVPVERLRLRGCAQARRQQAKQGLCR